MGARGPNLRERRAHFYKWAKEELGFSEAKVREIMLANGEETFAEDNIPHYRALLKAAKGDIERVGATLSRMQKEWQEAQKSLECQIPGCDGEIRRRTRHEMGYARTCSVGGDMHPIIWDTADLAVKLGRSGGRDHLQMVEYMLSERSKRGKEKEPA